MTDTPKPLAFTLLRLLADGEFHSGEVLARQLGMSRASVNNALRGMDACGLTLYSVRGRGYRLASPLQWLDAGRINSHLGKLRKNFHIEVLDSAPSSNILLLQRAAQGAENGSVLAVEWQSGGRGRRGRAWHSGLGSALTFSLLWRFDCGLSALSGLSLAVGVALIRALHKLGVSGVSLKWPNDILSEKGKLAGILIEAQGDMLGPSAVVVGIGLNLFLPQQVSCRIDQPATCLMDMLDEMPERNYLLAVLLRELHGVLCEFGAQGFAALRTEWERYHVFQNRQIQLLLPDGDGVMGIVRGVTDVGALELETKQGMRKFDAGEICLRGMP
jgi:BirA family transcriptional regulator, biotin operon repressor / biotin---[acetyl-CoA-carboxylase] ligase